MSVKPSRKPCGIWKKGSVPKKLVRGTCTPLEAADLRAEGIDVVDLPEEAVDTLN